MESLHRMFREREREREREMIDLKIVMEDFDKYPVQELRERERERETQSNLKNENKESKDTFFLSFLFLVALFFIELVTVAYDVGLF